MDKQYIARKRLERIENILEDRLNTMKEFNFNINADEFLEIKESIDSAIEDIKNAYGMRETMIIEVAGLKEEDYENILSDITELVEKYGYREKEDIRHEHSKTGKHLGDELIFRKIK